MFNNALQVIIQRFPRLLVKNVLLRVSTATHNQTVLNVNYQLFSETECVSVKKYVLPIVEIAVESTNAFCVKMDIFSFKENVWKIVLLPHIDSPTENAFRAPIFANNAIQTSIAQNANLVSC